MVLDFDTSTPEWDLFTDETYFDPNLVFNHKEWRKEENYKKVIKTEEESKDNYGNIGQYLMKEDFLVSVLVKWDEEKGEKAAEEVWNNMPHKEDFLCFLIE